MINTIRPLPAGSALRLFLTPPVGAQWWRVLRRSSGTIAGPDDAGAVVVADQSTEESILDFAGLVDGIEHTYQAFYWNGAAFVPSATKIGEPAATYAAGGSDVQVLVRERLELALAVEVKRGALKPHAGSIPVLTAPFASPEHITFPAVSVYFSSGEQADRAIGELVFPDAQDATTGTYTEHEGWLDRVTLQVSAVSLNADERMALRQALKRAIQANLPVFNEVGMTLVTFSQQDREQFSENAAPLYFTTGTFTCLAPAFVTGTADEIADVTINPTYLEASLNGSA